jgi:hypothetical protein
LVHIAPRIVKVLVTSLDPGFTPKEVATCFGSEDAPIGLLKFLLSPAAASFANVMERTARMGHPVESVFLCLRTGPLNEASSVVPTRVPGSFTDLDVSVRAMLI